MTTALDTDVAAMVGEMEVPACEHSQHGSGSPLHGDGPATHYIRAIHHCGEPSHAFPVCAQMVGFILADIAVVCGGCLQVARMSETHTILGPVNQ